jgi:hypothetical protein
MPARLTPVSTAASRRIVALVSSSERAACSAWPAANGATYTRTSVPDSSES